MDLQRIKQFIKNTGDKFIFVEDGEPTLVVMGFKDYERTLSRGVFPGNKQAATRDYDVVAASFETERLKQREQEMSVWHQDEQVKYPEKSKENIRLEDLPL